MDSGDRLWSGRVNHPLQSQKDQIRFDILVVDRMLMGVNCFFGKGEHP